jgi:hypothetical protein
MLHETIAAGIKMGAIGAADLKVNTLDFLLKSLTKSELVFCSLSAKRMLSL